MTNIDVKVEVKDVNHVIGQKKPVILACLLVVFTIVMAALFADGYTKINSLSVRAC